ncbi:ornithine cyclodeaminase family protein [Polaromonas sp. P1-6]|nr:ornithine cyclodeaminase family protein [Polaromonas sp. P1-6]
MPNGHPLLYLTGADIASLDFDVRSVRLAIHSAFAAYAAGKLLTESKKSILVGPGHAFQSLSAVDTLSGFAAVKWVGMVPPGGAASININASILLSDVPSGQLRCLMDGGRATALRTAGMTAVAAQFLARQDSTTIGFVGAGIQAEAHLAALHDLLPSLDTVYVNSGRSSTAVQFAERCRAQGMAATVAAEAEVVSRSDIVVTTVPFGPDSRPFLDAAWIRPGAFVAAIDVGRSWKHEGVEAVDVTVVDEAAMKHYAKPGNCIPPLDYAQATLSDLVGGRHPGRSSSDQRIMLFGSGSAVADLAIAVLVYERASAKRIGTLLEN